MKNGRKAVGTGSVRVRLLKAGISVQLKYYCFEDGMAQLIGGGIVVQFGKFLTLWSFQSEKYCHRLVLWAVLKSANFRSLHLLNAWI